MSESLIKRYNLNQGDFWEMKFGKSAGQKIIKFDGVMKIIDAEGIKFELSDNLDVSPRVAIKVMAYVEPNDINELYEVKEEITFGEANDNNCTSQYFWAMAEKRGKARGTLKLLGLYGSGADHFKTDIEADDFQIVAPTILKIKEFTKLKKQAMDQGVLHKDGRKWLKDNDNAIRNNEDVYDMAMKSLENALKGEE